VTDPAPDRHPASSAEAVEWLRKHFDAEAAAECEACFVFELSGPDSGAIGVRVENGSLEIVERELQPADVRFRLSAHDFFDVLAGCANPDMLFMEERLQVEGELGLALRFRRLFGAGG
jgi:putative sterol carrier protein